MTPLIQQATHLPPATVVLTDSSGEYSISDLFSASSAWASLFLDSCADLAERRVAFLVPPCFQYVSVQWGIWRAGGIAVPLCNSHPAEELAYVLQDSGADIVVCHPDFVEVLAPVAERFNCRFLTTDCQLPETAESLPEVSPQRGAMLVYTSGTTSKPKGALTTHATIAAQIQSLVTAWGWTSEDRTCLVLPLHHVHGIINILGCTLWSGARCELLPAFDAESVWQRLRDGALTVFMAVPTIYGRLIAAWEKCPPEEQLARSEGARKLRLMVSGSAALPVSVFERWQSIGGHALLERYGMTEIGMALSNPLNGTRRPGHVGTPLPGVEVRLVGDTGEIVPESAGADQPGEIQVRGANVFREYWGKPEATAATFTDDGWFKTGDIAVRDQGSYRILGRNSVDIIKTGGYKVSALEIEEVLREHPFIAQCAVIGVPDEEWGERVAAAVVLHEKTTLDLPDLRVWGKTRLAPYKIPSIFKVLPELPRNVMGKVVKPELGKLFTPSQP